MVSLGHPAGTSLGCDIDALGAPDGCSAPILWRVSPFIDYIQCSRRLTALKLPAPQAAICGEHLLLRRHAGLFPSCPWIYLPHSLLLRHELEQYRLGLIQRYAMFGLYRSLQRWALVHADRTVRFTRYACRMLEADYDYKLTPRFEVNPIGVALPETGAKKIAPSVPRLLIVGGLRPGKRVDAAIRALAANRHLPWTLDIVGEGAEETQLRALVERQGMGERIKFHGYQPHPERWYRHADVLLMPSRSESLGLVVLEAMAHGVPPVAMRADGALFFNPYEEFIADGKSGFLVNSDEELAHRLAELLREPARLTEAGRNARRYAETQTWEHHIGRYEVLFEKLLSERSGMKERRAARRYAS